MEQRDDATFDWESGFDFGGEHTDEPTRRGDDAPVDDEPIRKGGGPPGRSAFLPGGRLRRLSRDRGTSRSRTPEPAPSAFSPAPGPAAPEPEAEQAFRPITDWVFEPDPAFSPEPFESRRGEGRTASPTPPPPASTSYDPFEPFEPFTPETPAEPEPPRTTPGRSFPGGRAKLPRLNPEGDEAEVAYVTTAFIPGRSGSDDDENGARTGFHGYNTYESLFAETTIADPLTKPVDEDAYAVLGVSPDDDWKVVVRAHRQLVKANHPDRLTDAPTAVRQEAEERLRQINLAYREVKEHRREEGQSTAGDGDGDED